MPSTLKGEVNLTLYLHTQVLPSVTITPKMDSSPTADKENAMHCISYIDSPTRWRRLHCCERQSRHRAGPCRGNGASDRLRAYSSRQRLGRHLSDRLCCTRAGLLSCPARRSMHRVDRVGQLARNSPVRAHFCRAHVLLHWLRDDADPRRPVARRYRAVTTSSGGFRRERNGNRWDASSPSRLR